MLITVTTNTQQLQQKTLRLTKKHPASEAVEHQPSKPVWGFTEVWMLFKALGQTLGPQLIPVKEDSWLSDPSSYKRVDRAKHLLEMMHSDRNDRDDSD